MTPSDVLKLAKQKGALIVDLRFIDMPGLWQHFSIPVSELTEELFAEGIGFDGSSIRGFQAINESDMLLFPDSDTAQMDPFTAVPTLVLICDVKDPITGAAYARDPRYIARKAEAYVKSTGLADTTYIGPELEFFIFDDVRFDQGQNFGYYHVNAESGHWNSGRVGTPENPNLGYRARSKQGYFPVAAIDHHQDLRSEMVLTWRASASKIEVHHHEVATAGQTEIDMRFDTLLKMADKVLWYKYVTKNTAKKHGKTVTFMPKPIFQDNGSGMHTHQSLWKGGKNLFYGQGRLRGHLGHVPVLHRRHPEARAGAARVHRAVDQLVPAPGAGLRGAHQPGVQRAQPLGRGAHPDVLELREGEASGVPHAGPDLQPVPVVRGLRDGRASTACRTRSTRASRSTRTSTSCRPRRPRRSSSCRARWTWRSTTWRPTTSSC